MPLLAALVLDDRSDVPYAHLERQRVLRVHAAQPVHELDHVLHGAVRQALHAHEFAAARLREARDRTDLDSVKFSHPQPPCPAVRNRPRGGALPSAGLAAAQFHGHGPGVASTESRTAGVPAYRARSQIGRTCSARGPLAPWVTVYSTRWLSSRLRWPSASMAEWWTKTSGVPSSGVMNP